MLENIKSVYIIGIGGISMSALAVMLQNKGIEVKGSDQHLSELTQKLNQQGIAIVEGEAPEFVKESDAIILTGAVSDDNRDVLLAKSLGKKIFSRAEVLGMFSKEKQTISISGTHGKTTTTGMIATILLQNGYDPTVHIGGQLKSISSNLHIGTSELFVTEACEYKDAFLSLKNFISVVLNIEEDHLDYFKNFDNILSSFNKFIENTEKNGFVVYNYDNCHDKLDLKILKERKTISFGFNENADLHAINVSQHQRGEYSFEGVYKGNTLGTFKLSCFGKHNILNALASIAVSLCLGVEIDKIKEGIESFQGVGRRMEIVRKEQPFIVHDYAHHPQEIDASLKAIKDLVDNKFVCVFQPHTFSRTKALYDQFLSCFDLCDEVWLLPIYPAREKAIKGINSKNLSADLGKRGLKSRYFSTFDDCKREINRCTNSSFAILGAGDVENLAKLLKQQSATPLY